MGLVPVPGGKVKLWVGYVRKPNEHVYTGKLD